MKSVRRNDPLDLLNKLMENTLIKGLPYGEEVIASLTTTGLGNFSKILNCPLGQFHALTYSSEVRGVEGMVEIQRLSVQLGLHENFAETKAMRQAGVAKSTRKSNNVSLKGSLTYNTATKRVKVKVRVNKTIACEYYLAGEKLPVEKARQLIENARAGRAPYKSFIEERDLDLNFITDFA